MPSTSENVTGVVEKKGEKYSGSVLVNGAWLNFKKGTSHADVVPGRSYTFTLEPWEFKGKTGKSIVRAEAVAGLAALEGVAKKVEAEKVQEDYAREKSREAHGKTFCVYLSALFSNPSFTPAFMVDEALEETFTMVEKAVKRTFGE